MQVHFGGHFLGRSGQQSGHSFKSGYSSQVGPRSVVLTTGQYHSVSHVGHLSQQQDGVFVVVVDGVDGGVVVGGGVVIGGVGGGVDGVDGVVVIFVYGT